LGILIALRWVGVLVYYGAGWLGGYVLGHWDGVVDFLGFCMFGVSWIQSCNIRRVDRCRS
jgi:hypothetical protein